MSINTLHKGDDDDHNDDDDNNNKYKFNPVPALRPFQILKQDNLFLDMTMMMMMTTTTMMMIRYAPHKDVSSTTDTIYDDGPIRLYYNITILTIVLHLPTVFSTVTCCTGL